MPRESTSPLEAMIAQLAPDTPGIGLDVLAAQLGITLDHRRRRALCKALRQQGWTKKRTRKGDVVQAYWQRSDLDQTERELFAFVRGRANVTVAECCYALHALPTPDVRQTIADLLVRWDWVRRADRPDEWEKPKR